MVYDPSNLGALLNIRSENAIQTPEAVYISLEEARQGISLNFQAQTDVFWDLGDGNSIQTGPGKTFIHKYNNPGVYVVIAIGINSFGQKVIQAKAIVVAGDFAEFSVMPMNPRVNSDIKLDASASTEKGQLTGGIVTDYLWTCEGGAGCFPDTSGEKIVAQFQVPGTYAITLRVKTTTGQTDYATQEIFVSSENPFAHFDIRSAFGPQNAGTYFLDASYSTTRKGEKEGLTYVWNINGEEVRKKDPIFTHTFEQIGEQIIQLKVLEDGLVKPSETWQEKLNVESILAVDFSQSKEKIQVGETIDFLAQSPKALRYLWTFPEGKVVRTQEASHRFQTSGRKAITLEVSAGDKKNTVTKIIEVLNSSKPTALVDIKINGIDQTEKDIYLNKGDLVRIESKNVDRFGEEKNFQETWILNGDIVSRRDIATLFTDFGTYTVKYIIIDPSDPTQRDEKTFFFHVENTPPRIGKVDVSNPEELPAGSIRITAQAADKERDALTYVFKAFSYTEEIARQESDKNEVILTVPNGVYDFEVTVKDAAGKEAVKFLDLDYVITQVVNEAPTGTLIKDPISNIVTTTEVIFQAIMEDPDQDALFFDWKINGESLQADENKEFRYTFVRPGEYNISVEANDRRGGKVTLSDTINVQWNPAVRTAESNTPPTLDPCSTEGEHVQIGQRVVFQSQAQDADKEPLLYRWAIGNQQGFSSLPHFAHTFIDPGVYKVDLEVEDMFTTEKKSLQITAHPTDVIRPFSSQRCNQELDEKDYYNPEESVITTTTIGSNFLEQISWVHPKSMTELKGLQNLESLHDSGQVGIKNVKAPLEKVLAHREQVLLQLKQKTKSDKIIEKIDEEIRIIRTTPHQSLRSYLELLRPGIDSFKYTKNIQFGSTLFLQAKAPENVLAPLSFEWDLGNGQKVWGQNIEIQYPSPGFYLLTLTISDGLTPVQDSIIIQVDPRS